MKENVYTFGKDDCMTGIIATPNIDPKEDGKPAVLLLNAGILHRVGPYRLNVDLARKLTSNGFTVLRFDLSGIGDSNTRKDTRSYKQRAVDDVQEAMNFLSEKTGHRNFVLLGLCSGADNAHSAAIVDSRVVGIVFLDAYGYRTRKFYLLHVSRRLFGLRRWKYFIRRKYNTIFWGKSYIGSEKSEEERIFPRHFPSKEKAKTEVLRLTERGANLLYIYTGGVQKYYNYPRQFEDMFGINAGDFCGKLQIEYFPESDHIYTLVKDRNKLIKTVSDWLEAHY